MFSTPEVTLYIVPFYFSQDVHYSLLFTALFYNQAREERSDIFKDNEKLLNWKIILIVEDVPSVILLMLPQIILFWNVLVCRRKFGSNVCWISTWQSWRCCYLARTKEKRWNTLLKACINRIVITLFMKLLVRMPRIPKRTINEKSFLLQA